MKIARKSPELLILIMTIGAGISWAVWLNLLNNFDIEKIDFNGAHMPKEIHNKYIYIHIRIDNSYTHTYI